MTDNLFVGANPTLLYLSLTILVGGVVLRLITSGIVGLLIQGKINRALAEPIRHVSVRPPFGFGGFSETERRIDAHRKAVQSSGGLVLIGTLVSMLCYVMMGAGVLGSLVYFVQKYGVA